MASPNACTLRNNDSKFKFSITLDSALHIIIQLDPLKKDRLTGIFSVPAKIKKKKSAI